MQSHFMSWVSLLPEVGGMMINDRNRLTEKLARAEELEKEAAELRDEVRDGRRVLMERIKKGWTKKEIEKAQKAAATSGEQSPCSFIADEEVRQAIGDFDGSLSPLEVLQCFREGRVIRQYNLMSTATDEERRAALKRVLDWWNFGAVPLLCKLESPQEVAECS